ncbi:peroxide stress protein YaaA [Undibacterium sp. SXout7W]|uniref:peroxide stress protein YaaA n=1 Tax=Undibacterium sp. SXout7W TaxID=3413049 RepID=UPI003BF0C014
MLIVLSPAKSLDYKTPPTTNISTTPALMAQASRLIDIVRRKSAEEIAALMSLSPALSQLNVERYAAWSESPVSQNMKQAVLAFNGDVYEGLDAGSLSAKQITYMQDHVRILSGLYGVLRPLDALQPYRLEMGTKLENARGKNLYAFWGDDIAENLNQLLTLQQDHVLINLASEEYFKAVKLSILNAEVITPVFQDWKNGKYKIISFYAKRARGLMARYCAVNQIKKAEKLKKFDVDGYVYCEEESDQNRWVFRRRVAD